MPRAVFNDVVLAESPTTVKVEGNHYFPPESVNWEYFTDSTTRTVCPWKGLASYHDLVVDGQTASDVAWRYPKPTPLARKIKDHVAFYPIVTVEGTDNDESRPGLVSRLFGRTGA